MIYYTLGWNSDKNIGKYYNQFMSLIPDCTGFTPPYGDKIDNNFGCIMDGDTMFLTDNWGYQIEQVVEAHPEVDLLFCRTNRVGQTAQVFTSGTKHDPDDIQFHRILSSELWHKYTTGINDVRNIMRPNKWWSGFFMLVRISMWQKVGGFKSEGMLRVDNDFHRKVHEAGGNIYQSLGLYVYHYYRGAGKGIQDDGHLS